MRTTLTVEDDLMRELRELAHRKGLPLKRLIDRLLRVGIEHLDRSPRQEGYHPTTYQMGEPLVPSLDKALQIAAALEDDETARKLNLRK